MLLSPFISLSPSFPHLLSLTLFSMSAPPLLLCEQVHQYHLPRFHIYALIYDICFFSFWITPLCIIGFRFIHLIRSDSNSVIFHDWVVFHCVDLSRELSWWRIYLKCKRSWFDSWVGSFPGERIGYPLQYSLASLVAHMGNTPPAMWGTWVQFLVGKIPWRKTWQPTLVFLSAESPWTEEPVHGISKSQTQLRT